jgi:hypothetical protein
MLVDMHRLNAVREMTLVVSGEQLVGVLESIKSLDHLVNLELILRSIEIG